MNCYVATNGTDANAGTLAQPFRTIQKAADVMRPGDTCYIRAGVYRECVKPPRGGVSEDRRITYAAYPGETPEIKGSERITTWKRTDGNVWKTVLPSSFFASYNPYTRGITGEWLTWTSGHHLGDVYLNGVPFRETFLPAEVAGASGTWAVTSGESDITIRANFGDADPNEELAEINTRELVFFPDVQGLSYITVSGLALMHAANNWAPPESFQRGLIGVNWGRSWIIENCRVSDAKCVGISSGKFDPASPPPTFDINTVGHHIVRNNWVRRCGEAGIAGNMGFCASMIEGNLIEDINYKTEFGGEETAGIKVHTSVDVVIKNNIVRRVCNARGKGDGHYPGIWIDWCNQGARLTGNIVYDTDDFCLYLEACHGPLLVDNNIFVGKAIRLHAKRIVLAHNLFCDSGIIYQDWEADQRKPSWFQPHTRKSAGSGRMRIEGNRFFNNVFIRSSLENPNQPLDCQSDANLYYRCTINAPRSAHDVVVDDCGPSVTMHDLPQGVRVEMRMDSAPAAVHSSLVTHARIGVFDTVNQGIEDHQGKPLSVDTDILNTVRNVAHPTVGPVEKMEIPATRIDFDAGPQSARIGRLRPPP